MHALHKRRLKILFLPLTQAKTSERIPMIIKILSKHYSIVGIKDQRILYFNGKISWILSKLSLIRLILRGIKMGIKSRPDLIFCEEPDYALVGLIISKILRKPIIYDSHGNRYLLCVRLNSPLYYRLYAIPLDIMLAKRSTLLLVVSEHNKKYYMNQGIPPERIRVIPSCVDLTEIDKARIGSLKYMELFKGKKILLFFGTFSYQPNMEALLFINNKLAPALEDMKDVEIYIAGRAPANKDIVGMLHKKVKWLGFVPNIYEVLHAADVFICPLWKTVGIIVKVLDAMGAGKPIIVSRFVKEGIPELNESNAFLANDETEFIYLTRLCIKNLDKYLQMGAQLRKIIAMNYNVDVVENNLIQIIQELINYKNL